MKSVARLSLCLGVSALVSACGQSFAPMPLPTSPVKPLNEPVAQSLDGKSKEEVLKLKYKSIQLLCELDLKQGTSLETASSVANEMALVDLMNGLPENREVKLHARSTDRVAKVVLTLKNFDMHSSTQHADWNTRTVYKMEHSPFVTADFFFEEKTPKNDGFLITSVRQDLTLNEGIEFRPVKQAVASDPESMQDFTTFGCTLVTEIKPEYKDQFKVEQIQ